MKECGPKGIPWFFQNFPEFSQNYGLVGYPLLAYPKFVLRGLKRVVEGPPRSPDFFRIFPNFHILEGVGKGGGHQIIY